LITFKSEIHSLKQVTFNDGMRLYFLSFFYAVCTSPFFLLRTIESQIWTLPCCLNTPKHSNVEQPSTITFSTSKCIDSRYLLLEDLRVDF
jgi:hypothetical protein